MFQRTECKDETDFLPRVECFVFPSNTTSETKQRGNFSVFFSYKNIYLSGK